MANDPRVACFSMPVLASSARHYSLISSGGTMAVKVGINGFGRIGRNILRTALEDKNFDLVAVNDLTDPKTLAHLLKYDSILGNLKHDVRAEGDSISVEGRKFKVFKEKDPAL